jgi:hypothetical protein
MINYVLSVLFAIIGVIYLNCPAVPGHICVFMFFVSAVFLVLRLMNKVLVSKKEFLQDSNLNFLSDPFVQVMNSMLICGLILALICLPFLDKINP